MQNPPPVPVQTGSEVNAKTALGLDANLGAALGYPVGIIAIIIFFMEKENRFARFHAVQSVLLFVLVFVLFIVLALVSVLLPILLALIGSAAGGAVGLVVSIISTLVWVISLLVWLILPLLSLGVFILAAVKAYGGNYFKLPVIGKMAEKFSGGAAS